MVRPTLFFVTDAADAEARACEYLKPVLAHWQPVEQQPAIQVWTPSAFQLGQADLASDGVLWLVLDDPGQVDLYVLLESAERHGLAALLTRAGESRPRGAVQQDGVIIGPPETEPAVQCAMLQGLASQARVVHSLQNEVHLMNARRGGLCDQIGKIDEELRLAARLQQQFLPRPLPPINQINAYTLWRPAHYVSGDIYDITRLDENHIGLFLADAVGHGVPAALMTMYIKRSLKTKKIDSSYPEGYRLLEPRETLQQLNQDMLEAQSEQVHFATACYAILDTRTYELHVARAGHPYPYVLRAGGESETISPDGSLLGVFSEGGFQQSTTQLREGDRLLLYSDGFELAFPEHDEDGQQKVATDRYTREFEGLRNVTPDQALASLNQRVDAQSGSLEQQDDLTVVFLVIGEPAKMDADAAPATPASVEATIAK